MFLNNIKKITRKITPTPVIGVIKIFLNDIYNLIDKITLPFNLIKEYRRKKTWLSNHEIVEYRKKIKIYDVFNFYNELETLEIRLNVLNNYVDYFVIVESTLTHSGLPKELFYENNKNIFKKFENKIIHLVINNSPKSFEEVKERLKNINISEFEKEVLEYALSSPNIKNGEANFLRDFYEKEYIKKSLIGLSDDDFCFVSDLDEIWNPKLVIDYSSNDIFKFKQDSYMYYLNNRSNDNWRDWTGTIGTKYKNIKNNCLNHLRTQNKSKYTILRNGGWHFSFQGGLNRVIKKIESYSHQEINNLKIKSEIKNNLLYQKDIRGRHIKFWKDESNLPEYILKNKDKYKELFK